MCVLTQVVVEKRPLNGCSVVVVSVYQFQIEPIFLTILLFCGVATHLMCDRICSYDFAAKSLLE